MKRKEKTLLYCILSLSLCTTIVVGATHALFTDSVTVNNHLSAGNLKVGLERVSYKEWALNEEGTLALKTDGTPIDLTQDGTEIFTVENAVPTCEYEATIEVSNLGSTAFDYGMRILWTNQEDAEANDIALANQMQITVTSSKIADDDADGKTESGVNYVQFMLAECAQGNIDLDLGYLLKQNGQSTKDSFTVNAFFVNSDVENVNNAAMDGTLTFDVQVYATQKTK